jgi:pSer/pThr/pTyr-binding forkhead associated (FHA) protein
MSSPSWTPPYWAQPPSDSHKWDLLEIKQGNLLTTLSLNQIAKDRSGCITFGRMDDSSSVDIVTAHESCSRLHARLAFDSSGNLWLRDLKSNNGTFVNNVRLPPEACGKFEASRGSKEDGMRGCRGVMVYPGDVFKFGASTRIYCLEGPEEFDREERQKRQVADSQNEKNVNSSDADEDQQETACSWGMADSLREEDETARIVDPNLPSIESFFSSSKYTIPSSLQQLYKTYQTKQFKLQAIQTETGKCSWDMDMTPRKKAFIVSFFSSYNKRTIRISTGRIVQKEDRGVELSEGQMRQVEKNRERMDSLEKELEELTVRIEEGIHSVVHGVQISLKKKRNVQSTNQDDDVDDFYDRTAQQEKRQRTSNDEAESEQSLIQKWRALYKSQEKQLEIVSQAKRKTQEIQKEINSLVDEEEAFFLQNDLTLADEELNKADAVLKDIAKQWSETEYLLKIVNPSLSWNRVDGWIGVEGKDSLERVATSQKASNETNDDGTTSESVMLPPPPKTIASESDALSKQSRTTEIAPAFTEPSQKTEMPPSITAATTTRTVGPTIPPPPENSGHNRQRIGPSKPSTLGTLAALHQAAKAQPKANLPLTDTQSQSLSAPSFDPRKDEWSAPKDQNGSGRTSLHDKFKGRY